MLIATVFSRLFSCVGFAIVRILLVPCTWQQTRARPTKNQNREFIVGNICVHQESERNVISVFWNVFCFLFEICAHVLLCRLVAMWTWNPWSGEREEKKIPLKVAKNYFSRISRICGKKLFFANEIFLWCPLAKKKKFFRKKNSLKAVQNNFFVILNNFWKKNFLHKFFFLALISPW